jgi:hypothetical protein
VLAIGQQGGHSPHRAIVTFEALAVSPGGAKRPNEMLARLPIDFPASVLLVQRPCPDRPSLLSRRTVLMVKQTVHGNALRLAKFFPERHRLVRPDGTASQATRVQFARPLCDISSALRTMATALGGW